MDKTVLFNQTKGGDGGDMEFTEAISSNVIAQMQQQNAVSSAETQSYANVTWANESTKVYSKSMLGGAMEMTTCGDLGMDDTSELLKNSTDSQMSRTEPNVGEKTRIFASDGDDDMEFTAAITGDFKFCSWAFKPSIQTNCRRR